MILEFRALPLMALSLLVCLACSILRPDARQGGRAPRESLLDEPRQLTFAGRRSGEGYFSADGSRLVFQSERHPGNPFYQIYLMDLRGGELERVSPGSGKTTCGWVHPAGDRVLFASTHADPEALDKQTLELEERASGEERRYSWDFDDQYELYEADLNGAALRQLTWARGYDAEASFSPDGRWIAFASNRHAYSETLGPDERALFEADPSSMIEIYLMSADGSDARRLTDHVGYDGGPFFSPDGKRIVWRRFSEDGATAEIYTMALDGGDVRQLTRLGAMSWAPFYHPSGRYVSFATNLHGFSNFELYMVDVEGNSDPIRVTNSDGFDGLPVFSPDGTRLSWTSGRTPDKRPQIFLADWDHPSALRQLGLELGSEPPRAEGLVLRTSVEITQADLRAHVETLASERFEGRATGTAGGHLATQYVADNFRRLGLEPAGDDGSFFQEFEFTAGVSVGSDNTLRLKSVDSEPAADYLVDRDWRPLAFSRLGESGPGGVVFAGYGIAAPAAEEIEAYNSFAGLDLDGKWVLVLRYLPEDVAPKRRQHLSRYAGLRYKAMLARDRGARGLIVVTGPRSQVKQRLIALKLDVSLSGSSLYAISVSDEFAAQMLTRTGRSLEQLQRELDRGEAVAGFELQGVELGATIDLLQEKRTGRNALARLRAAEGAGAAPVVVGAHVDHIGRGRGGNSLARDDERDGIHYGADDNASGVSALLEIAELLSAPPQQPSGALRRDVIFAAWSGEEIGLLGSNHFASELSDLDAHGIAASRQLAAYVNMDMVGRLAKSLFLNGVGSSPIWPEEIERQNLPIGLSIVTQQDSYMPTDSTSFYLKGIPVLAAFTGAHPEYHTPRDTSDRLDYAGMQKIARLMARLVRSVASRSEVPEYLAIERPDSVGERVGLRAYLGTIPDYGRADVLGVALSGVAQGGPAAAAGLIAGDVIVELAGRVIENIYDYTYSIDALKIGESIEVVVVRDGARRTLTLTPESRE